MLFHKIEPEFWLFRNFQTKRHKNVFFLELFSTKSNRHQFNIRVHQCVKFHVILLVFDLHFLQNFLINMHRHIFQNMLHCVQDIKNWVICQKLKAQNVHQNKTFFQKKTKTAQQCPIIIMSTQFISMTYLIVSILHMKFYVIPFNRSRDIPITETPESVEKFLQSVQI